MSTVLPELKRTELKSTDIALVAADAAIVTISSVDLWAPPKLVPATTESALFNLKVEKLKRISYGRFLLKSITYGEYKEVEINESYQR